MALDATTRHVSLDHDLTLTIQERGHGRPILLLHGGAGPRSMMPFAAALAPHARVILATHPGFAGTARPSWFDGVADLALAYAELLEKLELRDVLVIGNSLGGWVAAEMATRDASRLAGVVLVNAVGVHIEGAVIADPTTLSAAQLSVLSFHEPARFAVDRSTMSPEELAGQQANRAALVMYGGQTMNDPKLLRRLKRVKVPVLVAWGEHDGVVTVEYGRAFANAFRSARFVPIAKAAHFPQLEQPELLAGLVRDFATAA